MIKFIYHEQSNTLWNVTRITLEDKEPNALPEQETLYSLDLKQSNGDGIIKNVPFVVINGRERLNYKLQPLEYAISEVTSTFLDCHEYDFKIADDKQLEEIPTEYTYFNALTCTLYEYLQL